ncbi:cell division protein FtsW [Kurthia zopfii]|uniref:Cell division protein FtsW (Lipid II flippase) n=1 Tax=Kurthia zopfii TaxID=1650 RepID=A0A8B4QDY0_9BACL|nr:FtsW/RodA/SpoVE family cell cycle protein [Kurthia zopfii]PWI23335.1 cell division protein FtsW [Kurthia zopfii]TDR42206.1 cell division protein FtsW (lipid II flippase) [Kurthia zopfii]GEK29855.1 cell division protein FtsW [Kurthia zopfii]STX10875.1 Rod shape-determining protein RodA [Kurthia zopfii]
MKIKIDSKIITILVVLCAISCAFIYTAVDGSSQYDNPKGFVIKQLVFYVLGIVLMIVIAQTDVSKLKTIAWGMYIAIFIALLFLIVAPESIAKPVNEAKSWYQIPFIGTFQPSEFMKFAILILTAHIIVKHNDKYPVKSIKMDFLLIGKILLLVLPPTLVVYKQPDTGMIMLYFAMIFPMLFFSKISKKILLPILAIPVTIVSVIAYIYIFMNDFFQDNILSKLSPHQQSRIRGWLDPFSYGDSAYQTKQGILAIGSGKELGKGFGGNDVYTPEKHTDFIFANIAEEIGFIGASFVLIILFLLIFRFVQISLSNKSQFTTLLTAGIISLLAFQIFQNVGMTMGVLPVTGVTLPFLSYGGSSLLSNMMLIGIMAAIQNENGDYMFTTKDD